MRSATSWPRSIELARNHGALALLIEDAASGQQLVQVLRAEEPAGVPSPIARRPRGDKMSRVKGASAMIEAGRLYLPHQTHWLAESTAELLGFPAVRHPCMKPVLPAVLECHHQFWSQLRRKCAYRCCCAARDFLRDRFLHTPF
ncbi:hypothetical protein [Erythrobacter alti]|uniref:phage terminase large subunit family protein n=1 Tax=Erythrobacter alti TaxID=1896145 RepID=UPI003BF52CA5